MSYKILLFDLDDTLIDFSRSEALGLQRLHKQFYQSIDALTFDLLYKKINKDLWARVGAKNNALMPDDVRLLRFKRLNEELDCPTPAHEIAYEYEHYISEQPMWLPDVKKAIEFLHQKGHILGIITNGLSHVQSKKKQSLNLHHWFDCFVVSDDVGVAKPNKAIFDIALEELRKNRKEPVHRYNKNSMLMVGDSLISDGHGAMNYGIHYCHINQKASKIELAEPPLTYHIDSVAQLPLCIGYEAEYKDFCNSPRHPGSPANCTY